MLEVADVGVFRRVRSGHFYHQCVRLAGPDRYRPAFQASSGGSRPASADARVPYDPANSSETVTGSADPPKTASKGSADPSKTTSKGSAVSSKTGPKVQQVS